MLASAALCACAGSRSRGFAGAMIVLTFLFGLSLARAGALTPADATFLQRAAEANAAEMKISQAAQTRATEGVVKAFADRMVEDHSASNRELDALARKKNVTLTSEPDAAHLMKIGSLQKLHAGEFDRAYVQLMVEDHAAGARLFEQAARDAVDADVRKFAQTALEMWRAHAASAQALPR
jgi:putative membrane protein